MQANTYQISGYCEIANGSLFVNGKEEYHCHETSLESTLTNLVKEYSIIHPRFGKMDRLARLGYSTIEILLKQSQLTKYAENEVSLLLSNTSSSLDTDFNYQASIVQIPSPALFVYTLPNIVMAEVCIKNKFKGENLFFVSDSFNTFEFHNLITEMFANNRAKACIAGWVEVIGDSYRSVVFLAEKETNSNKISDLTLQHIENCFKIK